MTIIGEWRSEDRSRWGSGPWDNEPDKIHFIDAETNMDCLMVRNQMGTWCGYVGVTEDHPWFGKGYSECPVGCGERWCEHSPESVIDVHGSLTFANACAESEDPAQGICHVAQPGRPDHVWWFGFDCAHGGDSIPSMPDYASYLNRDGVYRDRAYVESQVRHLAHQLHAVRG